MKDLSYLEKLSIENLLPELVTVFDDKIAFSTSFSIEDQLITHFIFSQNLPIRVFTLDTGRLYEETYDVLNRTRNKYDKKIEVFFPEKNDVEKLIFKKGPNSFFESIENRIECCNIRKVLPLNRALENVDCWITGIRAAHSENRKNSSIIEFDTKRNIQKINPLFNWTYDEVRKKIDEYKIPYNLLQDKGFYSIGCAPCTRALREGEDTRAGRWWWEQSDKKECGLHTT
jgi:phosphoadenosine phosphosulfate reductase